jgi:hypothetical protein
MDESDLLGLLALLQEAEAGDEEEIMALYLSAEALKPENQYRRDYDHPSTWAELEQRFPQLMGRWPYRFRFTWE